MRSARLVLGILLVVATACSSQKGARDTSAKATSSATPRVGASLAPDPSSGPETSGAASNSHGATANENLVRDAEGREATKRDGKIFVLLSSVVPSKREIRFDVAEFFEGDEAKAAAKEDGVELDTDYYIRNKEKKTETLTVDDDGLVKLVTWDHCCRARFYDWDALTKYFEPGGRYRDRPGPFFLYVHHEDPLKKVEEIYLA